MTKLTLINKKRGVSFTVKLNSHIASGYEKILRKIARK